MKKTFCFFASLLSAAIIIFVFSSSARCQWVQGNGLSGVYADCFAISGANIFAGTDNGGVFLSTDNGANWTAVNTGLTNKRVMALTVSGAGTSTPTLFAGTFGGGIFRSTNNGSSWSASNTGLSDPNVFAFIVSGGNGSSTVLFAGTNDSGIYRSTDNGSSWSTANSGITENTDLYIAAFGEVGSNTSSPMIFAGADSGGVLLSTNNGASWTPANNGRPDDAVYSLAVVGANSASPMIFAGTAPSDGIFLSSDKGSSWTAVNDGLLNDDIWALALSDSTSSPTVFAGSQGGGVFFSTNNGTSWSDANDGLIDETINALAVSRIDGFPPMVFAGTGIGVWRRPLSEFNALSVSVQGDWSTESSDGFTARAGATSCVIGGKIYVIGGEDAGGTFLSDLQVFDPSTNSWSTPTTTGTFTPRFNLASATVNGKIYVMGGISGSSSAAHLENILEVFDPATNSWSTPTTTGSFTARYGLRAAEVKGMIYVIGGSTGLPGGAQNAVDILEVFDPATNAWTTPATTGTFTARRSPSISVFNDMIYVFGGGFGSSSYLSSLEVFDPATNNWSAPTATGTPTARSSPSSSVLNGQIFVMGGFAGQYLNTVEAFDPSSNAWTTPKTTGAFTSRSALNSEVVGGKIYAMGGQSTLGIGIDVNEVYAPANSGVQSIPASSDLGLYPNPTNGIVMVHSSSVSVHHVTVANILGESVVELIEPGAPDFTLDLSKLAPGAYFIRISGDGPTTTRMIVRK